VFLLTPSSCHSYADNILNVTNQEFCMDRIADMRRIRSRAAYIELLDCLVKAVVGRKVYIENRMIKPLSEWFTRTDEAFLLLCLESYSAKWNREWAAARRQQRGEQKQGDEEEDEEPRYTGKSKGTKRSWSKEGLERFNALMIDVFRDREVNGTAFDHVFKEEMISRYGKKPNDETADEEQRAQPAPETRRVVMVYSDFNIEQFMAHATSGTSASVGLASQAERQPPNLDDEVGETRAV
jgi:hypothetical protein